MHEATADSTSPWRRPITWKNIRPGYLLAGFLWLGSAISADRRSALLGIVAAVCLAALIRWSGAVLWRRIWPLAFAMGGALGTAVGVVLAGTVNRPTGQTRLDDLLALLGAVADDALVLGALMVGGGLVCVLAALQPALSASVASPPQQGSPPKVPAIRQSLVAVCLLLVTLWVMSVSSAYVHFRHFGPGYAERDIRSSLYHLAGLQDEYHKKHGVFSHDLAALAYQEGPSRKVHVLVEQADSRSWKARAIHADFTTTCTHSNAAPRPVCQQNRRWFRESYAAPADAELAPYISNRGR